MRQVVANTQPKSSSKNSNKPCG